uniref:ZP domain-containing protein n=1 Tax=Brugia timori TaxID=42155 RepID=A0A0R3QCM0_9BILA
LVQIIDANGCGIGLSRAIELPVYMTSSSNGNPKHVYIYMYGFQFTSTQFVYFECQIRPCIHSCKRQKYKYLLRELIEQIIEYSFHCSSIYLIKIVEKLTYVFCYFLLFYFEAM